MFSRETFSPKKNFFFLHLKEWKFPRALSLLEKVSLKRVFQNFSTPGKFIFEDVEKKNFYGAQKIPLKIFRLKLARAKNVKNKKFIHEKKKYLRKAENYLKKKFMKRKIFQVKKKSKKFLQVKKNQFNKFSYQNQIKVLFSE